MNSIEEMTLEEIAIALENDAIYDTDILITDNCVDDYFYFDLETMSGNYETTTINGKLYRHEIGTEIIQCDDCGDVILLNNSVELGDKLICKDCFKDNYRQCAYCGEYHRDYYVRYVDDVDDYVCDDCLDDYFFHCDHCDEVCHNDNRNTTADDYVLCDHCYNNNTYTCTQCEGVYYNENNGCYGNDDYWYCDDCYDHTRINVYTGLNNDGDFGLLDYHDFEGDFVSHEIGNEEKLNNEYVSMGVELECEKGRFNGNSFNDWIVDYPSISNPCLIHFEKDGSLDRSTGIECITQPCTLEYHQKEFNWQKLCEILKNQGFVSYNSHNCGLHVHISRDCLSSVLICKLDLFINRNANFWKKIAQRNDFYRGDYEPGKRLNAIKGIRPDDYEKYRKLCDKYKFAKDHGRYEAVNCSKEPTIEIRIAKGTLKAETILAILELYDAAVRWLNSVRIVDIYKVTEKEFCEYVRKNGTKYPNAIEYIARKGF